jgi:hypothetical protein
MTFLASIKNDEVWNKIKTLNLENLTLSNIIDFGKKLTTKWIEDKLKIK